MTTEIKLDHVSLTFGNQNALSDLSFQLKGDKIYGLLGRNGAGKTSLLSLLASFRVPTEGTVLINGEIPFENDQVMSRVNFIYGKDQSSETEKVKGMLEFAERYRPNWDAQYAFKLVKRFNLPMDQKVNALSKGKQSALDVVIGLASRAPVTIFDEAYLGMDAPARSVFYEELIKDYAEHPRCVILSTHLISEVASLLEEVVIIDQGKLLVHESAEMLMTHGLSITGPAEKVDQLTDDLHVLKQQQLGKTKAVMIYGQLDSGRRAELEAAGLEFGSIGLQELFIYLTEHEEDEA